MSGSFPGSVVARPSIVDTLSLDAAIHKPIPDDVEHAAVTFVHAMAIADAETVWLYASEEDQDAFGTESAIYAAYADAFPAFTKAEEIVAERTWQEGDTPFVQARLTDTNGDAYRATMGFWLSDAGDWQLISCEVTALTDQIAGF